VTKQILPFGSLFGKNQIHAANDAAENQAGYGGEANGIGLAMVIERRNLPSVAPTLQMSHKVGTTGGNLNGKKVIVEFKVDPANNADLLMDAWNRMELKKKR